MTSEKDPVDGNAVEGPASDSYRPDNRAVPPEEEMRHSALGGRVIVQETSGVAAAEATGRLEPDRDEDPVETAGSG